MWCVGATPPGRYPGLSILQWYLHGYLRLSSVLTSVGSSSASVSKWLVLWHTHSLTSCMLSWYRLVLWCTVCTWWSVVLSHDHKYVLYLHACVYVMFVTVPITTANVFLLLQVYASSLSTLIAIPPLAKALLPLVHFTSLIYFPHGKIILTLGLKVHLSVFLTLPVLHWCC